MTAMWVIMFFMELFIPLAMIGFGRIFMRGGPCAAQRRVIESEGEP